MNARGLAAAGASLLFATSVGCRRSPAPATQERDCLRLEAPTAPVGFDAPFSLRATLACGATGGRVEWRQTAGPALRGAAAQADGLTFTARTPSIADALGAPPPWGIVPLSPATRGEVVVEATWTGDGGRRLRAEAHVAAASRSRGLPNTPVGARVHLGGDGWHVTARPAGSTATLDAAAGAASLLPDVAGDWRLADGRGHTLALRTARYDETPLDCGRAGCHADIAAAAARSPMTTVMARGLARTPDDGHAFGPGYPTCAIACHATGEPGVTDGGFTHVAAELGPAGDATPVVGRAARCPAPAGRRRLPRLSRTGGDPRGVRALERAARRRVRRLPRRAPALRSRRRVARHAHGARRPRRARAPAIAPAPAATPPGAFWRPWRGSQANAIAPSTAARPRTPARSGSPAPLATPCTTATPVARSARCCAHRPHRPCWRPLAWAQARQRPRDQVSASPATRQTPRRAPRAPRPRR